MEDPTTLALNMTFFGTLGLAFLMFIGLAVCMAVTLVLAGLARLLSIIVLAMVGIFPKNDADHVVRLPRGYAEAEEALETAASSAGPDAPAEAATAESATADGGEAPTETPARRGIPWKTLFSPKNWPTPGQLKARTAAAVETQAKHHPLLLAVTPEPPALNAEWAAAVAEADAREEAREEAREKSSAGSR